MRRCGVAITCGTGEGQGSFCAVAGPAYEKELPWLLRHMQAGDTFVDVGANIGIYSLFAARRVGPKGAVYSIEPSPGAMKILRHNIESNNLKDIMTPIHAAASRVRGQLYLAGNADKWNSLQLHPSPPGLPINVTTVDDILHDPDTRSCFRFLKIDAEGVETDVLEGAWSSIQTAWPVIVFENSMNRSRELPTEWLVQRGYRIFSVHDRNSISETLPRDYGSHLNLVAVHPGSRLHMR